jgi:hypothetical protein
MMPRWPKSECSKGQYLRETGGVPACDPGVSSPTKLTVHGSSHGSCVGVASHPLSPASATRSADAHTTPPCTENGTSSNAFSVGSSTFAPSPPVTTSGRRPTWPLGYGLPVSCAYSLQTHPNHPAHAGDLQTAREGDFTISQMVYHVTTTPSREVIRKCATNARSGKHPILLVPFEQEVKARSIAQYEGIDNELTISSIESFVAMNIIELATEENKDFLAVLQEIIAIYNRRLSEVETDLSLKIDVR